MQVRTRHTPSFGVARLLLAPAEPVQVEPGAMLATSYGVGIGTGERTGLLKSITRGAFRGGSVPVSVHTAPQQGGWVDVAPPLPGDLNVIELDGHTGWCVSRGAWLASASTVRMETKWGGFHNLFGGETGFLMHLSGQGPAVLACFGALDVMTLQPGEFVTVGTGHVIAYADTVQTRLRQLDQGGPQSLRSGAGLVFDFAGPGQVFTQTRDPRGLAGWLQSNSAGGRG